MESLEVAIVGGPGHAVGPPTTLRIGVRPGARPDLPARGAGFVGRTAELAELAGLLTNPECRLVTIVGPRGDFPDGVAFAPLQAVADAEALAPALATALGCTLTGRADARAQVARFLRPARLLLILDNVEHLIDEAPWFGELLATAPGLRLLATSREALNLREEWRYPLAGLAVPTGEGAGAEEAEAVRLFVARARQVRPDFALAAERAGVIRLCRSTEGLPLALELAASWATLLPCDAIADEIARNLDFLARDLRNVPARHRSMRAAFDYSWALLTEDERRIFRRLAIFRGGFDRAAAARVAAATLPLLASLVDKSLVRREGEGRFGLHELLRQYADEQLRATPEEAARVGAAHRDYYLAFLAARAGALAGGGQREATAAIGGELDNIRAAWRAAAAAGDIAALGRAANPLALFYDFRARYREGQALLEEGLRAVRAAAPTPLAARTLAALLIDVVRFHHRLGQLPAMRAALAEVEARHADPAAPPPPGQMTDPQVWRGILALIDGHYAEAARLGAAAVRRNTDHDRPANLPAAWWVRATAALWQDEIDAAEEYARRCSDAAGAAADHWHLAYGDNNQGHVAAARGDLAGARRHYEASYALREALDDPEGMGTGLAHLARIVGQQGDWPEAARLYRRSLAIAREIGDRIMLAHAINGLGLAAGQAGDDATAGQHLAEGLRLMSESRHLRTLLAFLVGAGEWLHRTGRAEEAARALSVARAHPASDHETRARAGRLLDGLATHLSPGGTAAGGQTEEDDPVTLAGRLIPLLTAPLPAAPAGPPARAARTAAPVEALSARELAVLQLIADELSLAVNTVRAYSQQVYGKLGVGSRTQAVARARELGILT